MRFICLCKVLVVVSTMAYNKQQSLIYMIIYLKKLLKFEFLYTLTYILNYDYKLMILNIELAFKF